MWLHRCPKASESFANGETLNVAAEAAEPASNDPCGATSETSPRMDYAGYRTSTGQLGCSEWGYIRVGHVLNRVNDSLSKFRLEIVKQHTRAATLGVLSRPVGAAPTNTAEVASTMMVAMRVNMVICASWV